MARMSDFLQRSKSVEGFRNASRQGRKLWLLPTTHTTALLPEGEALTCLESDYEPLSLYSDGGEPVWHEYDGPITRTTNTRLLKKTMPNNQCIDGTVDRVL